MATESSFVSVYYILNTVYSSARRRSLILVVLLHRPFHFIRVFRLQDFLSESTRVLQPLRVMFKMPADSQEVAFLFVDSLVKPRVLDKYFLTFGYGNFLLN